MNKSCIALSYRLHQSGMRLTPQRIAVYDYLVNVRHHPTAQQIYEALKGGQFPSLSLATVYNNLDALVNLGCVNVLGGAGDDNVHYDANLEPHINLACISCHQIVDMPSKNVNEVTKEISRVSGHKILGSRVVYYGICAACQNRQP